MPSPERSPQRDGTADSPRVRAPHRARVAAVVALIVLFFLFWFTLSLVANDPVGLVFTFVSVFLIAFSAWFFLVRRGVRRLLVLPLGLFALVALLTYGYDQKYQLVVMIALLVLFGLAARYAVRHHQAPLQHAVHRHARPAQPAQKGVLIINPKSGDGKAERFQSTRRGEKEKRRAAPARAGRRPVRPGEAGDHEWRTRDRDGGR